MATIAVIPLARPTFDVPYAEARWAALSRKLSATGHAILGPEGLLFDAAGVETALDALAGKRIDLVLIAQVTFTDAVMTVKVAERLDAPLLIWAVPEPRAGGRLRLNAYCGVNLAAHALGRAGKGLATHYEAPETANVAAVVAAHLDGSVTNLPGARRTAPDAIPVDGPNARRAAEVIAALRGTRIGLVGEHPAGFDTCRYDPAALDRLIGATVEPIRLPDLFARAAATPASRIAETRARVEALDGIDAVDQGQLDKSLGVHAALRGLADEKALDAIAVRCWPEFFTEHGCAACGPMGLMTADGTPCACEADVYGALSTRLLQEVAGEPAWLVDIVDMDPLSDTGVIWHCGSAPEGMRDPNYRAEAQIHSNRRMPLLFQFPLKAGRVTFARFTQARNGAAMVVATGEMLTAPPSFTGTSGVVRFDTPAAMVSAGLLDERLEHHLAVVYGDHRATIAAIAAALNLDLIDLTPRSA
jgi:L-fucose isomerase-like protein